MVDSGLLCASVMRGEQTRARKRKRRGSVASQTQRETRQQLMVAIELTNQQNALDDGGASLY
jgi:hypothetical protein